MFTQECKVCKKLKLRIWKGRRKPSTNAKIYVDEAGKQWNGRSCYDCEKERSCFAAKLKRLQKHEYEAVGPEVETDPLTSRTCRRCNQPLPSSRYFMHVDCAPSVDFWDMGEAYSFLRPSYGRF